MVLNRLCALRRKWVADSVFGRDSSFSLALAASIDDLPSDAPSFFDLLISNPGVQDSGSDRGVTV